MDDLKKYLQQHKDEMDADVPPNDLLHRIQLQTVPEKKNKLYPVLVRIAAAACILAVVGLGIKWLLEKKGAKVDIVKSPISTPAQNAPAILPSNISPDTLKKVIIANANQKTSVINTAKNIVPKKLNEPYLLMQSFEYNYSQLVKLQLKNIRSTPVYGETSDYFNDFKQTLHQIDNDEATIKNNIKTNGLNDVLLEQLINVYQQKINLLKNLQQEMNKINNKVKENGSPADSLKSHFINI